MLLRKLMADPKLHELTTTGNFRAKVLGVLTACRNRGFPARVGSGLRSLAEQKKILARGNSKTLNSLHLGKHAPDGLASAADIISSKTGWNLTKREQMLIGAAAEAYGLGWGGLFNVRSKGAVLAAIRTLRKAGWPPKHEAYNVAIGWDPYHVQRRNNWPK